MLANKTFEDARRSIVDWVEGFGVSAESHKEAVDQLALLTEHAEVSELLQRLSLQVSYGALAQEDNTVMKMGVAHCLNELSNVLRA